MNRVLHESIMKRARVAAVCCLISAPASAIDPDRFEPNACEYPTEIGHVAYQLETGLTIHAASDEDWYNVTYDRGQRIAILFSHASGDLDLELWWPECQNLTRWHMVQAAATSTTDNEIIDLSESMPGSVTVRVFGKTGTETHPDYDLLITTPFEPPELSGDLDFGDVRVGDSAVRNLTIHNRDPLDVLHVQTVIPSGPFSVGWSGDILPGYSQSVPVTFAPSQMMTISREIVVHFLNADSLSRTASGRGVQSAIRLEGDLSFGDVELGYCSNRVLTICNDGNTAFTVTSISASSGFMSEWSGPVNGGVSNGVVVEFCPGSDRVYAGSLTVHHDADIGVGTINSDGRGIVTLTLDSDGDGICDAHEFISGTSLTNDASYLCVQKMEQLATGECTIEWSSVSGRSYSVYSRASLYDAVPTLQTNVCSSPPTNQIIRSMESGAGFFEIHARLEGL